MDEAQMEQSAMGRVAAVGAPFRTWRDGPTPSCRSRD